MKYLLQILLSLIVLWTIYIHAAPNPCLDECRLRYPSPRDRPAPCCGCCDANLECTETKAFSVCCAGNGTFCGCPEGKPECGGYVYNGMMDSPLGTCFNNLTQFCDYNRFAKRWLVCPRDHESCYATTCCKINVTICVRKHGSLPKCAPVRPADRPEPEVGIATNPKCGDFPCIIGEFCCRDAYSGNHCYDAAKFTCTVNDVRKEVLCPRGHHSCKNVCYDPKMSLCVGGQLQNITHSSKPPKKSHSVEHSSTPPTNGHVEHETTPTPSHPEHSHSSKAHPSSTHTEKHTKHSTTTKVQATKTKPPPSSKGFQDEDD